MTQIKVRKIAFEFPRDLPAIIIPGDIRTSCELAAISFTMPYLEPYLIRSMRSASAEMEKVDPATASDMRAFCAQEMNHFQNHARINDIVRSKLNPNSAAKIAQLEADMDADYQRFTKERDTRFNLAYAEGFEAMTFALGQTIIEKGFDGWDKSWSDLWEWHLVEEIEHRTVTFDAYHKIYRDYWYRMRQGVWAQVHFLSYVYRMSEVLRTEFKAEPSSTYRNFKLQFLPRYMRTIMPWYHPGKVKIAEHLLPLWDKYDELAATQ